MNRRTSKSKDLGWCSQEWKKDHVARHSEQRDGIRQGPDQVGHCRPWQNSWVFYKKGTGES